MIIGFIYTRWPEIQFQTSLRPRLPGVSHSKINVAKLRAWVRNGSTQTTRWFLPVQLQKSWWYWLNGSLQSSWEGGGGVDAPVTLPCPMTEAGGASRWAVQQGG